MNNSSVNPITILGAGAWGTALALYLAGQNQAVRLWSVEQTEIDAMLKDHVNTRYLPGFILSPLIEPMKNLAEAVAAVEDVLIVVPSAGFRQTLASLKKVASPRLRILSATKGLDENTGQLLHKVAEEILGRAHPFAVLSGPSFAREVASGLPCAVDIASQDQDFLHDLQQRFSSHLFHVHPTNDVIGVEIGGVIKNVIAIATGIVDGLELGANVRSTVITYGLNEIIHLGTALGGQASTFLGLSGLGDLILTCSDNQSRNRRLGLALGRGQAIEQAERELGHVAEGKHNAKMIAMLAAQHGVAMPICTSIWQILQGKLNSKETIMQCLSQR